MCTEIEYSTGSRRLEDISSKCEGSFLEQTLSNRVVPEL
jgi:hypothetical protein